MDINELKKLIDNFNDIGETNKHWEGQPMNYENEYIKVVRLDDSNRHNRMCYSKLDKMWSIIYVEKKPFYNLTNFKEFKNEFSAYISSVSTGVNRGCVGIRIPDMKQCPTTQIAKSILDFIFEN